MSFGSLFDGAMLPYAPTTPASKPLFASPALSLALQSNHREGQTQTQRDANANANAATALAAMLPPVGVPMSVAMGVAGPDDNDSRSGGSDHLDALSADDLNPPPSTNANSRKRKKRYHRHTPQQIQELEALFKECPHPDEKQRAELSKRLCLETRQVKFWFQNRRTQMKMQIERHENTLLRQDNNRLRAENLAIKDSMRDPICHHCGGPAMLAQVSLEEQHLRMENARLKDELTRVCALAGKLLGKPLSSSSMSPPLPLPIPIPNSSLDLAVGTNAFPTPLPPPLNDFSNPNNASSPLGTVITPARAATAVDNSIERSVLLDLALSAIDELVKMAQMEEPLWIPCLQSNKDALNYEEYLRSFNNRRIGVKPVGFVSEATRETGVVIINSMALIEILMDSARWSEMFSCVIASATTTEVLSSGMGGSRNGALQLMRAEFQVLSPLVPIRDVNFLRFCKQLAEGCWAVVDVSIDEIRENASALADNMKCRRLPSGCLVQDLPNGYCKVTWVEHVEYEEAAVHQLYRPILQSGLALGAHRWLATLQRQCECLAILMSSSAPTTDNTTITASGKRSMLKLAQRMTDNFCAGVCASSAHKWSKLVGASNVGEDVKVMTRQSVDEPGEPPGVVLSAATSVWVPVAPQRLFDFLRDERLRSEWDILSNGGPMQEMAHIAKGQHHGNSVSLLRASAVNSNQSSMLILQETCTDPSGSMVVYAPVDIPAMHLVMSGGDSTYVALLPSGFAILPDGPGVSEGSTAADGETKVGGSGSLLTVAFQILVNSQPTAKLTVESVETVNNLISCTIQKIKAALNCDA